MVPTHSGEGSRPPLQSNRLSSVAQVSHARSSSLTLDDSQDYHDAGPSNTPTKNKEERSKSNPSPQRSEISTTLDASEDDIYSEGIKSNIYEKETGGTRAKIPDEEHQTNGVQIVGSGPSLPPGSTTGLARKRRRDRLRLSSQVLVTPPIRDPDKTTLTHVMLQWEKEEVDDAQRFVLNTKPPASLLKVENSIIWQHSEFEDIKLSELEPLINQLRSTGLQESEIGLTGRLLKRVKLVSERAFVGGSFLTPTAIRYDMLDDSRYSKDKCCIFLGFPYFAVARPQKGRVYDKGDDEHPTRTLLQSHYRLNQTVERDRSQCVSTLDGETLRACVEAPKKDTIHLSRKKTEELIYVPQLWAVIMGLGRRRVPYHRKDVLTLKDRMVTAGPISGLALRGSAVTLKDDAKTSQMDQCSFVRISFLHRGMLEELTYPLGQCASWFGLLNKHQQIRSVLKQSKVKTEPKDYRLCIGTHFLEDRTWASIQRSTTSEVLNIWMETPKLPRVSVKRADGDTSSDGLQSHVSDDEPILEARSTLETNASFPRIENVPLVTAFLAWRVLDDFGETDGCSIDVKMSRFLNAIYRSLSAVCEEKPRNAITYNASSRVSQKAGIDRSARPKITIQGKVSRDVDDLVYEITQEVKRTEPSIEQKLFWEYRRLFNYFVPTEHDPNSAPVQLFWGLLYEIVGHHPYLSKILERAKEINAWAERLHLGVHCRRNVRTQSGLEEKNFVSDSAILLASMIDALGATFNMLVATVQDSRALRQGVQSKELALGKKISSLGKEACRLLEAARDQLITEATGTALNENVGPVVTPEAILIILMERLVYGVYRSGSVDIIIILEECLEQLALKVEKHSSRRLLQKINGFQEEVDIVNAVLLQQRRVLLEFRKCLDPEEFKKPTTARKMRFEFEKKGIERVLRHIREQIRHCKELKDRANLLEIQNVHLVETFADDNSRAIFVFTLITIVFLPLSFVAGFFGMNVIGISGTTSTTHHFWVVGGSLTCGIIFICGIFIFKGEDVFFFFADLPRNLKTLFSKEEKQKSG